MRQPPKQQRTPHPRAQRPQVRVGVIISQDQQVLLVRRVAAPGKDFWSPPGGYLEYGESPQQCAIRQAREGAGITIINPIFRAMTNDVFKEDYQHSLTVWMEGTYVPDELPLHPLQTWSAIGWFPWVALPEPLFLPFEHLLTGQCDPAPWSFTEDEGR